MRSSTPSRLAQLRRHLRRARARWRLHRMEWNSMHAPLEPPKGYEHFHTEAAVFPGRASKLNIRSWAELKDAVRGGFKLYKHHYFPDPEIIEMERQMEQEEERKQEERVEERVEKFVSQAAEAVETGKQRSEEVAQALHDATPVAKQFLQDRMSVLQDAVSEFSAGFQETLSGEKNVWGQVPGSIDDHMRDDNPPVVYRTQAETEGERGKT